MIIIIRPERQALETKMIFEQNGYNDIAIFSPIDVIFNQDQISIFLENLVSNNHDSLIFTSQNALFALQKHCSDSDFSIIDLPVFVVGKRTAQQAKECGFQRIYVAENANAEAILPLMLMHNCQNPLFGAGRGKKKTLLIADQFHTINVCDLYQVDKIDYDFPHSLLNSETDMNMICLSSHMFKIAQEAVLEQNPESYKDLIFIGIL